MYGLTYISALTQSYLLAHNRSFSPQIFPTVIATDHWACLAVVFQTGSEIFFLTEGAVKSELSFPRTRTEIKQSVIVGARYNALFLANLRKRLGQSHFSSTSTSHANLHVLLVAFGL